LIQNLQKKGLNNNTIKAASPIIKEYVRSLIKFANDPQSESQMRQYKNELTKKLRKLVVYEKSAAYPLPLNCQSHPQHKSD
jgi:hypothetical protein